jgi:hypothetical protein
VEQEGFLRGTPLCREAVEVLDLALVPRGSRRDGGEGGVVPVVSCHVARGDRQTARVGTDDDQPEPLVRRLVDENPGQAPAATQ